MEIDYAQVQIVEHEVVKWHELPYFVESSQPKPARE